MFKLLNNLQPFFTYPNREYGVREYAKLCKIAPATASKYLHEYEKNDILLKRKDRLNILFRANLEHYAYKELKVYYTISLLRKTGLIEELNQHFLKPTIIVFGSAAKGEDTELSDVDLLIISEETDEIDLKKYEKLIKREVHLFVVSDIKDVSNNHLVNNILNGIIIQGYLKWT